MPAAPYVPLRIFSCYTMLEGAIDPKAAAKQAKRLDFPAAALTDRNGLYGVMPFTDACLEEGVQPIVAALLGVARPGRPEDLPPLFDAGVLDGMLSTLGKAHHLAALQVNGGEDNHGFQSRNRASSPSP